MKILFTLNSSNYGGVEKTVLDLIKGLPGYVKFVVCPKGDLYESYKEFAEVHEFRQVKKFDLEYIIFLRKLILNNEIHVVHANEPKIVFNTLIATMFTPVKVKITHTHTPISLWRVPFFNKILNILLNSLIVNIFSTYEVALTNSIRSQKLKEGILSFRLKVIPNSLDSEFIRDIDSYKRNSDDSSYIKSVYDSKKYSFLFLSRLTKEKNQVFLVETFFEFQKKFPNTELIIAGKGEDYDIIKKKIRDLNLFSHVKIIEKVSYREKLNLYLNCDCFVFPSLAEGFGITLIEAMYSCYPVISSNLPVLKEVAKNRVLYFKTGSSKSLYSKMLEAYKTKTDKEHIEITKEFIKSNYSINTYIQNYMEIYKI